MEAEWDRADPVAETRWIETVSREHGLPSVCVGHADPGRPDIEEVLAAHARSPLVRGIRHKPHAAGDPREAVRGAAGSMDDPAWRRGYALLERFGYGVTDAGQDMSGLIRMIHSAYEVLSNSESRQRYDAQLVQEAAMADAELKASLDQVGHTHRVQNAPTALRNALVAVAA